MLDVPHADAVAIDRLWATAALEAALPEPAEEFFSKSGPLPARFGCRRQYARFWFRSKALLEQSGQRYAGYVRDVSRTGFGIVSPVQLFPREKIGLQLIDGRTYQLEITRCRRLALRCYSCGSRFVY